MNPDLAAVLFSNAIQIAGAIVFAIVLRHFEHRNQHAYVRFWIWSWLAFVVYTVGAVSARLMTPAWPTTSAPRIAASVISLTAAMLQLIWMLMGSYEFSKRRRLAGPWTEASIGVAIAIGLALTLAWIADPAASTWRYFARVGVRGLLAAIAFGVAAGWFVRENWGRHSIGSALLPLALALYGLDQAMLVVLALPMGLNLASIAPLRFTFGHADVFLQLLIGLGMLFWLLEREHDERLATWARMAESEERYRTLAESATDAIITIDESSRIVFANTATARTFGYDLKDLIGQPLLRLMPEAFQAQHLASLASYCRTHQTHLSWTAASMTGRHSSGRDVPLEMSLTENVIAGQRLFTGILRDVSERVRQEEERRQAQKMEAIGRLAGGVAHDFNNLLTAIGGNADLALQDLGAGHPAHVRVTEIQRATRRAADLTGQLLTFSRRRQIQPEPVDLNTIVTELGEMLGRLIGENIVLDLRQPPDPVYVQADASLVYQVVLNLAVNARDAMPSGGPITIEVTLVDFDESSAASDPQRRVGAFACLRVGDRGSGILPEHLPHIFEPFFTTKDIGRGTGLGLATSYGVIQQHNGWIEVTSEVGVGTSFRVFLPRTAQPPGTESLLPRPTRP